MKLSDLQRFFEGKTDARVLHSQILQEVQDYERLVNVKGSSTPVTVINDSEILVSPDAVSRLCKAFLESELTTADLMFIADGLLLANYSHDVAFMGEELVDLVGELTDPEINGPITRKTVEDVLSRLNAPN